MGCFIEDCKPIDEEVIMKDKTMTHEEKLKLIDILRKLATLQRAMRKASLPIGCPSNPFIGCSIDN